MLTCCRASQPGPPRVAYAIGRRSGGAVERNRIRRRLRHIVAAHSAQLRPDCQYLLGANASALHATPAELNTAWLSVLERAHGGLS